MLRKRGEVRGEKKILTVAGVYSTTTQQERNNNEAVAGAALRQSGASTTTQEFETGEKTVLKCLFEWITTTC